MPMRDFKCLVCEAPQERYYSVVDGVDHWPTCNADNCEGELDMTENLASGHAARKNGIFPYTTTHITGDGKPVTVESLGHLRRLEKNYGVNVSGFSQNPGNPDSPRDLPEGRPGGRAYEGPRVPWLR